MFILHLWLLIVNTYGWRCTPYNYCEISVSLQHLSTNVNIVFFFGKIKNYHYYKKIKTNYNLISFAYRKISDIIISKSLGTFAAILLLITILVIRFEVTRSA